MDFSKSPKEIIKQINDDLQTNQVAPGLRIGEEAPEFNLQGDDGKWYSLNQIGKNKNVVISFYRGDWCGHCKRELKDINDNIGKIEAENAIVIAIAPQKMENAGELKQKFGYQFLLLSDPTFQTIRDYKIDFEVHQAIQDIYTSNFKLNIPKLNANGGWELPVPATFILNKNGVIQFSFVQMDYTQRMSSNDIINQLQTINSKYDSNV